MKDLKYLNNIKMGEAEARLFEKMAARRMEEKKKEAQQKSGGDAEAEKKSAPSMPARTNEKIGAIFLRTLCSPLMDKLVCDTYEDAGESAYRLGLQSDSEGDPFLLPKIHYQGGMADLREKLCSDTPEEKHAAEKKVVAIVATDALTFAETLKINFLPNNTLVNSHDIKRTEKVLAMINRNQELALKGIELLNRFSKLPGVSITNKGQVNIAPVQQVNNVKNGGRDNTPDADEK